MPSFPKPAALLLSAALLAFTHPALAAPDIVAGPMVGHVTEHGARIWMQLSVAKEVKITCIEDRGGPVSEVGEDVEGPLPYVCDLALTNLKPNKNYHIEIKIDDKPTTAGAGIVIRTPPPVGEETPFSVAFASGMEAKGKGSQPAYAAANNLDPRTFFFLGNTVTLPSALSAYPPKHLAAVRFIAEAYSKQRQEPDLQQLFHTTACYSVWDDHDFGITDADKNWIYKKEAWTAFTHFWPNPDWGTPANIGCYFSMTIGDADFFMLDSRMYRDPESDPNRKTMLGNVQLDWLKQNLKDSKATFKIIGCASQLLTNYGQGDNWALYQPEQKNFLNWIFDNHISGVVFVTGSEHAGEISALKTPGYDLFEITSSGFGQTPDPANPHRQGQPLQGNQFGTLDFGGVHEHRFITLHLRDEKGNPKLEQTLSATQLKN